MTDHADLIARLRAGPVTPALCDEAADALQVGVILPSGGVPKAWLRRAADALSRPVTEPFQTRVQPWMMACFGAEISADQVERNHRFIEEALELVQSLGCTASEAHQLVDYVFGRPMGEPHQEAGGVMVTLAALCLAAKLDMHDAAETELARVWTKVEKIRAKQAAKPKHSPLPEVPRPPVTEEMVERGERAIRLYVASIEMRGGETPDPMVDSPEIARAVLTAALGTPAAGPETRPTGHVEIAHDGFAGDIIGYYTTREGKRGVVVQQDGTRVVHVYGEKWIKLSAAAGPETYPGHDPAAGLPQPDTAGGAGKTPGQRIIDGLKDALAGNFAAVTIDGVRWVPDREAAIRAEATAKERERCAALAEARWMAFDEDTLVATTLSNLADAIRGGSHD